MSMNVVLKLWTTLKLYSICPQPHTRLNLGPHSLGCFSMSIFYFFFLEGCQCTRNFSMKWLIKTAQWFAWQTTCSIVFGRLGNLIRFSDSRDWAAAYMIFEHLSGVGEMVSAWHQEQVRVARWSRGEERAINRKPRQQGRASLWCLQAAFTVSWAVILASEKGLPSGEIPNNPPS